MIDTGNTQDYERLLMKVVSKIASTSGAESAGLTAARPGQETPILDRAWYLARHMFRE